MVPRDCTLFVGLMFVVLIYTILRLKNDWQNKGSKDNLSDSELRVPKEGLSDWFMSKLGIVCE